MNKSTAVQRHYVKAEVTGLPMPGSFASRLIHLLHIWTYRHW